MVRIGGLASGMDIDQLVSDLMKAERMPLDKLKQKKQVLEWQRDDYRTMNSLLLDFRSELTQMKLTTRYRSRLTTTSNEAMVTATASGAASQSSYSISKVTQLASAETRVNGGSISADGKSIDPSKSLYAQESSFMYKGNHTDSSGNTITSAWKNGAILSKNIDVSDPAAISFGDMSKVELSELSSWSVKVNGIGFNALSEAELTASNRPLKENEVLVKEDGTLQFGKAPGKGSVIKIDYVATERTGSHAISSNTSSIQLAQGALNEVKSIKIKETASGTTTEKTFSMGNIVNGEREILDEADKVVGTLNYETGKITFNSDMQKPADGSDTTMTLEIAYDHKYTAFSVDTSTSKGERHDSFLISGSESLNNVISKVNASSAGVNMFFDSATGQMTMTRTETGDFNKSGAEITTSGSFLNDVLRFKGAAVKEEGRNAEFVINGLATNRSSNTFEVNGVTFTLKQTFEDQPVSINVSNDSTKVFDNIKAFVDKYNEMIDKIQKKTSEERYRSYTPLTDEQREQLSDKQQEQWEERAKSGLLRKDSTLQSVLSGMRMNFYQPVSNDLVSPLYNQLASIGIKTTSNYLEGGKLEIDEAALKKAIEDDPVSVENLFRGEGQTDGQRGIAHRLYDTVNAAMDKLKTKAGNTFSTNQQFTIGRELNDVGKRIDSFENKLKQVEDRYWRQFTAMEKAIQRSNEQSMFLMNQFSGGM
ncbi:flagellar filament capping protein FliD [Cytobacillus oceanisediminis]|uniref:flagellar filament capping protein FliD n=1 Tax=Cytobacillus oceanisediminis TaxID=665099 RepID=UPI001D148898|nr:flagellar filament capping protein FliD [Cytobacillus oceanisediminis]MCC3648568.1 flagellar filament capping protein FliD [Cytobacillus oceanisediminis]